MIDWNVLSVSFDLKPFAWKRPWGRRWPWGVTAIAGPLGFTLVWGNARLADRNLDGPPKEVKHAHSSVDTRQGGRC